ncbi:hypothetical protein [Pseudoalteromonas sp. UCD-33C]|uniref:hypothetical protein n=1 Tax=Pseudoalteromonas sp. UCD-33C TaxID=1716175 RepID=UPI0006CA225B|nr:hypothetical protein [Pseudoalteromonas sp. UCD-33C]KPM75459.1 hypothetical protein AOG26_16860 [Pseudoalteromonas sp. UCD-33C]
MYDIAIVVVLYGNAPHESSTLNSLCKINFNKLLISPKLYVRDNSKDGYLITEVIQNFDGEVVYDHDGVNLPLAKVYNNAISFFENSSSLIILDDDSTPNESYFLQVVNFLECSSEVAVPIIEHSDNIISPGIIKGVKGCTLSKGDLKVNKENFGLVAMMSGTIIKTDSLKRHNIVFDERLTIYGVDTRFFLDCHKSGINIYVLDYCMEHDSALRSKDNDFTSMFFRFSNLMQAQFIIHENKKFYKLSLFLYFPFFIIAKVLRLKDVRFLKLFKNYKFFWKLNR